MDGLPGDREEFDAPEIVAGDLRAEVDGNEMPVADPVVEPCGRCRKPFSALDSKCPHCGAARRRAEPTSAERRQRSTRKGTARKVDATWGPWNTLLVGYTATLLTLVVWGLIVSRSSLLDVPDDMARLERISMADGVLSGIALTTFFGLRKQHAVEIHPPPRWWVVWPAATAAMAAAIGVNFAYHEAMESLGLRVIELVPEGTEHWWWWMASVCIQPAIFEELFFRGCCWRVMTPVMGVHTTILVSSVMFGMSHIGVPLSVPVLTLVGVVLGYARAYSGSIWLPAFLHFVHNLVVILW